MKAFAVVGLLMLGGCAAAPRWQDDVVAALRLARAAQQELVVYFALPGRAASDCSPTRRSFPLPDWAS